MILVAATAVGLTLARTLINVSSTVRFLLVWPGAYFLLALTLAYLPIRLRKPRPTLRRLVCQPGMAACCAVAIVAAIEAIAWGIFWAKLKPEDANEMLGRFWRLTYEHPGPAVAATWLGLILSRRWRPEAGWIDRVGRVIGALWLVTMLCNGENARWGILLVNRLTRGLP